LNTDDVWLVESQFFKEDQVAFVIPYWNEFYYQKSRYVYYVDVLEVKHNAVRTTQIPISLNNTGVSDTRRTLWFEDRKWHLCDENGNNNIQISNLLNKVSFKLKNQNSPSTILLPNRSYLDYFANGKEYTIM
jgi:hypothetical protein